MSVKEALQKGRARVEAGWCKFDYQGPNNTFCALGAIGSSDISDALPTVKGALHEALPCGHRLISSFNDDPETTKDDVLALFDRAIARCEETNASQV